MRSSRGTFLFCYFFFSNGRGDTQKNPKCLSISRRLLSWTAVFDLDFPPFFSLWNSNRMWYYRRSVCVHTNVKCVCVCVCITAISRLLIPFLFSLHKNLFYIFFFFSLIPLKTTRWELHSSICHLVFPSSNGAFSFSSSSSFTLFPRKYVYTEGNLIVIPHSFNLRWLFHTHHLSHLTSPPSMFLLWM